MHPPPLLTETDDRFVVGPSAIPGAGLGLFARVDLPAGATLDVVGVLIARESDADRCTHFADRHKFRVGDHLLIPIGFGGMVNHSPDPNLDKIVGRDRVWFRLRRDVLAGEELVFEYSEDVRERLGMRCGDPGEAVH